MNLRIDRLLNALRDNPVAILSAIDNDPLLIKRTSGDLVLANASQVLYTPQQEHHLYAKGIVYQREPYRLVSLPLLKIYNIGERDVSVNELTTIAGEPGVRLRFLRKMDGSLIQVFHRDERLWFTTRGMIDGARWRREEQGEDREPDFDYLGESRQLAQQRYPRLFDSATALQGKTLLFEFIHPGSRKITNYGDLCDLILLACFDHAQFAYLDYDALTSLANELGLTCVEMLTPGGEDLAAQIDSLISSLVGTDEEGSVICFEANGEVIYRVKVKSPEYLQLMRLMAFCTYSRTVEIIDANPKIQTWEDLKGVLQGLGSEKVPEEVLEYYQRHWERYQAYITTLRQLAAWAKTTAEQIDQEIGGRTGKESAEYRKAFAERAKTTAYPGLLFAALDDRLDLPRLRKMIADETEATEVMQRIFQSPARNEVE